VETCVRQPCRLRYLISEIKCLVRCHLSKGQNKNSVTQNDNMLISTSSRRMVPELGKVVVCLDRYVRSMGKVNGASIRTGSQGYSEVSTRRCEGGLRITCNFALLAPAAEEETRFGGRLFQADVTAVHALIVHSSILGCARPIQYCWHSTINTTYPTYNKRQSKSPAWRRSFFRRRFIIRSGRIRIILGPGWRC
jgi:hypothetical protein